MKVGDKFTFISENEASKQREYENERRNSIEKVRLYHEDRDAYEVICIKNPSQRLAFDFEDKGKGVVFKKASNRDKIAILVNENENEQINLF